MIATLPGRALALYSQDELPEEFGWISWLNPGNQRLFFGEVYAALASSAPEDELAELVDAWQATAELDHDPETLEAIERNRTSLTWASVDEWMKSRSTE